MAAYKKRRDFLAKESRLFVLVELFCLPLEGKVGFAQQNSDEVEQTAVGCYTNSFLRVAPSFSER